MTGASSQASEETFAYDKLWRNTSVAVNNPLKYSNPTGHIYCSIQIGDCDISIEDPPPPASGGGSGGNGNGQQDKGPGKGKGHAYGKYKNRSNNSRSVAGFANF